VNFPIDLLFLRDDDIPQYIADGVIDAGIVGENIVAEKEPGLRVVEKLGFGKCRLSLAIPKGDSYEGVEWFNGKKVATSYPGILNRFFEQKGIQSEIEEISGSVEIAPGIGLSDAVCDIVSTGSTLLSNGLKEVETVMLSEAVLVTSNGLRPELAQIIDDLVFRLSSLLNAQANKYILLNAPNGAVKEICAILPGMKSPTILPLADSGWSSVHSVIGEDEFWENIDKLKSLGAQGILVCPIEKMIL
jgi:ATP phosphoribosyltransferase